LPNRIGPPSFGSREFRFQENEGGMTTTNEPQTPSPASAEGTPVGDLLHYTRILYDRGLICATGGNTSVRVGDTVWVTKTGAVLGELEVEDLVPVGLDGAVLGEGRPSKELGMHLALYGARPGVRAVMHVHPLRCIAYSALHEPGEDSMPPFTAAFYMRAGRVPMVPYFPSGSHALHEAVAALASRFHAILLKNHGVIVGAIDPASALGIVEEMEQNAHLGLILGEAGSRLTPEQCAGIDQTMGRAWG